MIPPTPQKYICKKCGFVKIYAPKSDSLSPMDIAHTCPKCKDFMIAAGKASAFDTLLQPLQNLAAIFKGGKE